jgi:hypothetical protein
MNRSYQRTNSDPFEVPRIMNHQTTPTGKGRGSGVELFDENFETFETLFARRRCPPAAFFQDIQDKTKSSCGSKVRTTGAVKQVARKASCRRGAPVPVQRQISTKHRDCVIAASPPTTQQQSHPGKAILPARGTLRTSGSERIGTSTTNAEGSLDREGRNLLRKSASERSRTSSSSSSATTITSTSEVTGTTRSCTTRASTSIGSPLQATTLRSPLCRRRSGRRGSSSGIGLPRTRSNASSKGGIPEVPIIQVERPFLNAEEQYYLFNQDDSPPQAEDKSLEFSGFGEMSFAHYDQLFKSKIISEEGEETHNGSKRRLSPKNTICDDFSGEFGLASLPQGDIKFQPDAIATPQSELLQVLAAMQARINQLEAATAAATPKTPVRKRVVAQTKRGPNSAGTRQPMPNREPPLTPTTPRRTVRQGSPLTSKSPRRSVAQKPRNATHIVPTAAPTSRSTSSLKKNRVAAKQKQQAPILEKYMVQQQPRPAMDANNFSEQSFSDLITWRRETKF